MVPRQTSFGLSEHNNRRCDFIFSLATSLKRNEGVKVMNRIIIVMILLVAFIAVALTATSNAAMSATTVQGQSGYWAQIAARDATLRDRPGGSVIKVLTKGQWVHIYPSMNRGAWVGAYACPNGNRGCANRSSTPGYILRSALLTTISTKTWMPDSSFTTTWMPDSSFTTTWTATPALYVASANSFAMFVTPQNQERRVCAREVWMRNDKLWPIEILRAGDRFVVERYTDGSKNDGNARWAIGRAKNLRGRVLLSALCR
jgi:hypothetical protein